MAGLQIRVKCVSAHKVVEGKTAFYDCSCLAAAASEQAPGVFVDVPRGKLNLQRLAAAADGSSPFEQDKEYTLTIERVPDPPAGDPPAPGAAPDAAASAIAPAGSTAAAPTADAKAAEVKAPAEQPAKPAATAAAPTK